MKFIHSGDGGKMELDKIEEIKKYLYGIMHVAIENQNYHNCLKSGPNVIDNINEHMERLNIPYKFKLRDLKSADLNEIMLENAMTVIMREIYKEKENSVIINVSIDIGEQQCNEYDFYELDESIVSNMIDEGLEYERSSREFAELRSKCLKEIYGC